MKNFKHPPRFSTALILSDVFSTLSIPVFATTYYRITDLGVLPGMEASVGIGINESGHVVGWSHGEAGTRAFLWETGEMTDLGDLPGGAVRSTARAINDAGQVVGDSMDAETQRAILWGAGTMVDLGGLPGSNEHAFARDINSAGQVIGRSIGADSYGADYGQATLWESTGSNILGLGDLPGGRDESSAHAINDVGQVVGESEAASGSRAVP